MAQQDGRTGLCWSSRRRVSRSEPLASSCSSSYKQCWPWLGLSCVFISSHLSFIRELSKYYPVALCWAVSFKMLTSLYKGYWFLDRMFCTATSPFNDLNQVDQISQTLFAPLISDAARLFRFQIPLLWWRGHWLWCWVWSLCKSLVWMLLFRLMRAVACYPLSVVVFVYLLFRLIL